MNQHDERENDDRLTHRLRGEALHERPAFSPGLHARVMTALWAAPLPEPAAAARRPQKPARRFISWAGAGGAALAVAAAVVLAALWHGPAPKQEPIAQNPPMESAAPAIVSVAPRKSIPANNAATAADSDLDSAADDVARTAAGISDWVQSAADDNQWAGLDHDAQAALATVAGPLPFDLSFSIAATETDEP